MPIKKTRPKATKIPGIYEDGPERFLVRARWTDTRTGKRRKREGVAKTFAEAVAMQERLEQEDAPVSKRSRQRFADYAAQWMNDNRKRLEGSTAERYEIAIAHAIVDLGQVYVDAFEPADFRRWRDKMVKTAEATTVNSRLRVLRQVMDVAVEDRVLIGNPARAVKSLPEKKTQGKRGNSLVVAEFRRVLDATRALMGVNGGIAEDVGRMILTVAWTGVRRGELLALKIADEVDGELQIEHSVWSREEKMTKTDDPRRITIMEPLRAVLAEQRQWLVKTQHEGLASGLFFPADPAHARAGASRRGADEVSWYRSTSILDEPLTRVVEAAKVKAISPHSFRRTWEIMLRKAGVEDVVRRSIAGWRTEEAQAIYEDVDRADRDDAAVRIMDYVMGSSGVLGEVHPTGTPEAETQTPGRSASPNPAS